MLMLKMFDWEGDQVFSFLPPPSKVIIHCTRYGELGHNNATYTFKNLHGNENPAWNQITCNFYFIFKVFRILTYRVFFESPLSVLRILWW